jgi:hypothetical protein
VIHERAVLHEAFDQGLCVSEYRPIDEHAMAEMADFYREIFESEKMPSPAAYGKFNAARNAKTALSLRKNGASGPA